MKLILIFDAEININIILYNLKLIKSSRGPYSQGKHERQLLGNGK